MEKAINFLMNDKISIGLGHASLYYRRHNEPEKAKEFDQLRKEIREWLLEQIRR